MAAINFDITADGHQVKQEVSSVTRSIGAMAKEAEGAGVSMKEMFKQAALFSGAALGVAGVREFASQVMNVRKEMQSFQISFDTLLGSRQKGQEMLGELKQFAATTPLMLKDLAAGAQTMLGFNLEAERVVPTLKAIGDISMGDAQKFQSLTLAFSQMSATGKLMGQDLLQMINAGFNPLTEISRKTGKSIAELKEEMANGAISAEMVADAFMSATSEGGKFFGMLEKQGQGLAGQMNQLQGAIQDMFAEIGEQAEDVIVAGIQGVTDLVHNYEQVGRIIASIVAVYGSYRAAVMAVTVVQQLETTGALAAAGAHGAQAVAIGVATKAAAAFNATLLANPFVAVTVLMTAFAASIWRTSHELTAAEKGSRAYNESLKEWRQNEQQLNSVMSENLAMLQDVNESDYKRQQALDALKERYPSLFRDYDIETIKLADIAKLKREIAALDESRNSAKISGDIDDLDAEIKRYEAMIRAMGAGDEGYIKKLEELKESRKEAMREYSKVAGADYAKGLANVDDATLDKYVAELERRIRGKARDAEIELRLPGVDGKLGRQALFSVRDVQGIIDMTKARKQTGSGSEAKDPYQQQARKAYADWERAKKEYDRIVKDSKSTKEEVDKAYAEMERLDKAYADLTHGDKASAVSKAGSKRLTERERINEQLTEIEEKQAQERQRAEKDRELAIEQAAIDALKEGGDKKRRQIALDYTRQVETIEREKQDLIRAREEEARELWEAQNAGRKDGATWQSSGAQAQYRASASLSGEDEQLFQSRLKAAKAAYDQANADLVSVELQHMREYLSEFGTIQEKRLAIAQDYDEKIANADDEWQRKSLERQRENALKAADDQARMEAIRKNPDYIEAMIDPSMLGTDALRNLNEMLGEAKTELAELPADQLQAISDLMRAIDEEIVARNPFAAIAEGMDELASAREGVQTAREEMQRAAKAYKDAVDSGADRKTVDDAKKRATKASKDYQNALDAEQRAEAKVRKGRDAVTSSLDRLAGEIQNVAGATDQFGGKTSKIISTIGGLVNFVGAAIKTTSLSTATAIKTIESASVILAVISAAIQLATQAAELFGLSKDDSGYEDAKAEYQTLIGVWDDLISKKKEYLAVSWGNEATNVGKDIEELIRQQQAAAAELARERLRAGASAGSHSYGYRMNRDLQRELSAMGLSSVEDLTRKTGEQLEEIRANYAYFWAKLDGDFREYLEDIIEGQEQLQELQEDVKSKFAGMTFEDLESNFKDTLMDMSADASDTADDVAKYFMNALLDQEIGKKYKEQLKAWYDDMAGMIEANGGTLTDAQMADLQDRYQSIVRDAVEMRDRIAEATGYGVSQSALATSASSSFTQESVDEVNGRMTALQLGQQTLITQGVQLVDHGATANRHLETIAELAATRNGILNDIYARMASMSSRMSDALTQIADNTRNI